MISALRIYMPDTTTQKVVAALRWLNADERGEAQLAMDEIPRDDEDGVVDGLEALLEMARDLRASRAGVPAT